MAFDELKDRLSDSDVAIENILENLGRSRKISYVDARCAEGKTLQAILVCLLDVLDGKHWLLAQPTNELIGQTAAIKTSFLATLSSDPRLRTLASEYGHEAMISDLPFVTIINSEKKAQGSVQQRVIHHLYHHARGRGSLLIITHSTLFSLPKAHRTWSLIIDEAHQCFSYHDPKVEKTGRFILNNVKVLEDPSMPGYLRVEPNNKAAREELGTIFENDTALETYQQIVRELLSRSFRCYVHESVWKGLSDGTRHQLTMHSVLVPEVIRGFSKVTIMSGRFDETLLYLIWSGSHFKVKFERNEWISARLSGERKHDTGRPVKILHALPGRRYSKTLNSRTDSAGRTLLQMIDQMAAKFLDGKRCLCIANNDIRNGELFAMEDGKRVSSVSHGIDRYKSIHNFVFLSALNLRNESYTFLKQFGVTTEQILVAITYHAAYQGACRTSIRLGQGGGPNIIIVPTYDMAVWLAECFENSTIEPLPGDFSEFLGKRERLAPMTSTERSRKKDCIDAIKAVLDMNGIDSDLAEKVISTSNDASLNAVIEFANERSLVNRCFVGRSFDEIAKEFKCEEFKHFEFFDSSSSKVTISAQFFQYLTSMPTPELHGVGTFDEFHALLVAVSKRELRSNTNTGALAPATFGDLMVDGKCRRDTGNLKFASLLVLDIDDGELTPDVLRIIFPRVDLITYGTFSGNGRFRAIFRLSLLVNEILYKTVRKLVIKAIAEVCPKHGIKDCPNPVNLFRLPARGPKNGYPVERQYGGALDVLRLLKGIHIEIMESCLERKAEQRSVYVPSGADKHLESRAQRAISKFEEVRDGNGRHAAFYRLAVALGYMFKNEFDVRHRLDMAHYDHPEKQRKIEESMRSLRKIGLV